MVSIYEQAAREAKVAKLLEVICDQKISADLAADLDVQDWNLIAELADCKPPSEATVAATIERLRQIEQFAKRGAA